MAFVAKEEIYLADTASDTGSRSINREFNVHFTPQIGEGSIDAILAVGLKRGEQHPRDPLSCVGGLSARVLHSIFKYTPPELPHGVIDTTVYRVVVTYTTDEKDKYENPCDRPPIRDWDTIEIEAPVEKAWDYETTPEEPTNDVLIVNVVGDPLQGVTEPEYLWVFSWSKDIPKNQWNPLLYQGWLNCTNLGEWQGLDDNVCRFVTIKFTEQEPIIVDNKRFEYGSLFVQLHIKQKDSWLRELLNAGFRHKTYVPGEGDKIRNIEIDGVPVSSPQLLDEFGAVIKIEDINDGTKEPHYLSFQTNQKKDFSTFPQTEALGFTLI